MELVTGHHRALGSTPLLLSIARTHTLTHTCAHTHRKHSPHHTIPCDPPPPLIVFTESDVWTAIIATPLGPVMRVYEFDRYNSTTWQVGQCARLRAHVYACTYVRVDAEQCSSPG